jgi:predicted ferric reductase
MIPNAQPRVAMIPHVLRRVAVTTTMATVRVLHPVAVMIMTARVPHPVAVVIMTARVLHPLVTAGARALRVTAVITVMVVIVVTRRAIIRQILVMNKKSRHRQLSATKSKLTVCR